MRYNIIEDCLKVIPNKFELVVLASQRAYNLSSGSKPTVEHLKGDRVIVIALSEIAHNTLDLDVLYRDIVQRDIITKKGVDDLMVERSVLDLTDVDDEDSGRDSRYEPSESEDKSSGSNDGISGNNIDVIFDNDIE